MARRRVPDGKRALQVMGGWVEGRIVHPGQHEEAEDHKDRTDAGRPDPVLTGSPDATPDSQQDTNHTQEEEGQYQGHGQQVVEVLVGLHGHLTRIRVHRETFPEHEPYGKYQEKDHEGYGISQQGLTGAFQDILIVDGLLEILKS